MRELLIICPLVFLGGLVDSIAGGGGLIALPAYYLAGLPAHMALGTNKFSSTIGTSIGVARFARGRSIHIPTVIVACVCALTGSALGARLALVLSERVLQIVLIVTLPVMAVFLLTRKALSDEMTGENLPLGKAVVASGLIGLVVGAYDGFFGPGAGTFLILCHVFFLKFDLRTAMGNSRVINLASNAAAMVTLASGGKVILSIGIPAALCGMLGHYIGSGLALKNGAKIVRPVMVAVIILLMGKIVYDFFIIQA